MKVTHYVGCGGHFIQVDDGRVVMSIRTKNGTAQEVREAAAEEQRKANRIQDRANMYMRVALQMEEADRPNSNQLQGENQ